MVTIQTLSCPSEYGHILYTGHESETKGIFIANVKGHNLYTVFLFLKQSLYIIWFDFKGKRICLSNNCKKTHKGIPFIPCKWKVDEGLTSEELT